MDSREYLVPSSETLSTTHLETQLNQQILVSVLKEEIENDMDEENSPASAYNMDACEPLQLSEYVNYYDSKVQVLEDVKKEFPVNEYSQTVYSKIIYEDMGLVNAIEEGVNEKYVDEGLINFINKEKVKNKNSEEALSLNVNNEHKNRNYEVTVKLERIDEKEMLENVEDTEQSGYTSVHYDVLVTPGEAQCKFCDKLFQNSFDLLKHYNEHITIKINTPTYNGMKELNISQQSFKRFDRRRRENPICELCGKQYNNVRNLKRHIQQLHDFSKGATNGEMKYKCDTCGGLYRSKDSLTQHIKRVHYDFGRTFACWCGKVFRTPIHLCEHKRSRHDGKLKNEHCEIYRCDHCQRAFHNKANLVKHMKRIHYDYGKVFKCWCGKKFRNPYLLSSHKNRSHNGNNDGTLTTTVQCDICQKLYKNNYHLQIHRKNIHHNYNCLHDGKLKDEEIYRCDHCQRTFNNKINLMKHIRRVHYNYGKMFKCWCGKKFRTPYNLRNHKSKCHNGNNDGTIISTVQCDVCQKLYKSNYYLRIHRKRMH